MFYLVPHFMSELVFKDQFGSRVEERCDRMIISAKSRAPDMKQTFIMLDRDDSVIGTHSINDDLMEWIIIPPPGDTSLMPVRFIRDYIYSGLCAIYYNDGVLDTLGYIDKYYSTDNWCTDKLLDLITDNVEFKDNFDYKCGMIVLQVDNHCRVIRCYKNPNDKQSVTVTCIDLPDQESITLLTEPITLKKAQLLDVKFTVKHFTVSKTSTREHVSNAANRVMKRVANVPMSELDTLTFKLFDAFAETFSK